MATSGRSLVGGRRSHSFSFKRRLGFRAARTSPIRSLPEDLFQLSFPKSCDISHAEFILADNHKSGFKGSDELFIRGV